MHLTVEVLDDDHILAKLASLGRDMHKTVKAALRRAGNSMRGEFVRGIRQVSYLKAGTIRRAFGPLKLDSYNSEAYFNLNSSLVQADEFKAVPNRITARKKVRPRNWQSPGYLLGPGESLRRAEKSGKLSAPFIAKVKGKKRMYQREGNEFMRVGAVSVQYFSVFERVEKPALEKGAETFQTRLVHEIEYRLGNLS